MSLTLPSKLLFVLMLLLPATILKSQSITVSPTRLFFTGAPGTTQRQTITIANSSKLPMSFKVSFKDWYRDSIGNKVYLPADSRSNSNAAWLKTSENTLNIMPGSVKELSLSMQIPEKLSNDSLTNAMLLLTQIPRQDDVFLREKNVGLKILFEFGLHVYHTPESNHTQELDFTAINHVKPSGKDTLHRVAVKVKNLGNVNSDATVELELLNKSTGDETKLNPVSITMMPGAEQIIYFSLPKKLNGPYKCVSIIRLGGNDGADVRVGEKNITL